MPLTDDRQVNRQERIQNTLFFNNFPNKSLEKKAASVFGHRSIDPIIQAKVFKLLKYIIPNDSNADPIVSTEKELKDPTIKKKIRRFLNNEKLDANDDIWLPVKKQIYSLENEDETIMDDVYQLKESTNANIVDFESLVFNNNKLQSYLEGTSFADYVYVNILYSLGAKNVNGLQNMNDWQAKLALLINETNSDCNVAKMAFYDNSVEYEGQTYDTSFVPKYPVFDLIPRPPTFDINNDVSLIEYYEQLNIDDMSVIPIDKMSIFYTFPFKKGFYIKPNGKVVYLNYNHCSNTLSSSFRIGNLCNVTDIQSELDVTARSITLDEAKYHAIYAESLEEQGMALLLMRRILKRDYFYIKSYRIDLPSDAEVLSWTKNRRACSQFNIIFPKARNVDPQLVQVYVSLIKDIANSCYSRRGASIMCGPYNIPEFICSHVYDGLESDAEKYVFFTLMIQDYQLPEFIRGRKLLFPVFGTQVIDLSRYPEFRRQYMEYAIENDKGMDITEPLILGNKTIKRIPQNCAELYQFTDNTLNFLVENGSVDITSALGRSVFSREQIANFITLTLSHE